MQQYVNITGYKFVSLQDLETYETQLRKFCRDHQILGTILLSTEGINIALAGLADNIIAFKNHLETDPALQNIFFKDSYSETLPFRRLYIKIKPEIIAMRVAGIDPNKKTGKYLSPTELKRWYDENRDMAILDTRNEYEIRVGTFERAIDLHIENFRDFPQAVKQLPEEMKKKPLVMFCTGGVRCEKASALLMDYGFEDVYQLDGGIVKYFEDCHGEHWNGECFVFDDRVAVKKDLSPTEKCYCLGCLRELTDADLESPHYVKHQTCPHCIHE